MSTLWIPTVVFYIGVTDAALIMVAGLIAAALILASLNVDEFWARVFPAGGILILTNIAAAIVLFAVRAMVGGSA